MAMTTTMTLDKWIDHFRKGRSFYYLADLCKLSGLSPASARRAAERLRARGILQKTGKELYINTLSPLSPEDLSALLCHPSYVSCESALFHYGIIEQAPFVLTCVGTRASQDMQTPQGPIVYHHIKPSLFCAYRKEGHHHIAEPEKAVLDLIYLKKKRGESISTDEWHWEHLSRQRLKELAQLFPKSVQREMTS